MNAITFTAAFFLFFSVSAPLWAIDPPTIEKQCSELDGNPPGIKRYGKGLVGQRLQVTGRVQWIREGVLWMDPEVGFYDTGGMIVEASLPDETVVHLRVGSYYSFEATISDELGECGLDVFGEAMCCTIINVNKVIFQ